MDIDTDSYVIATFALWAGDFDYCVKMLSRLTTASRPGQEVTGDPLADTVVATCRTRLRQIRARVAEFGKLSRYQAAADRKLVHVPCILQTPHIRGAVWRTGEREFVMQAYLTDIGWQAHLFEAARGLAQRVASAGRQPSPPPRDPTATEGTVHVRSKGASWIALGNPFMQIHLTDMGLLKAGAIWIEEQLPSEASSVKEPFQRLLNSLENTTEARQ